jgi:hypothetical protein
MRYLAVLAIVVVTGCSRDSMTRNFTLSRDAGIDTAAATQTPLSVPPSLGMRPLRPGALAPNHNDTQPNEPEAASAGQAALVQSAGPVATSDIRTLINENSGLVYPDRGFVDQLMLWEPPPGHTPVITQAGSTGWFSRIF